MWNWWLFTVLKRKETGQLEWDDVYEWYSQWELEKHYLKKELNKFENSKLVLSFFFPDVKITQQKYILIFSKILLICSKVEMCQISNLLLFFIWTSLQNSRIFLSEFRAKQRPCHADLWKIFIQYSFSLNSNDDGKRNFFEFSNSFLGGSSDKNVRCAPFPEKEVKKENWNFFHKIFFENFGKIFVVRNFH